MLPNFEDLNNGQELCIMSYLSSFSKNHFFRKIGYEVLLAKIGLSQIFGLSQIQFGV